ncbi:Gfo/Idh/MocA family protein [Acidocella sp.]|uniref:Gfo/Idh/MocA family protein n=1 Tax=Acidocella sp. TaxID=50710 RepID=UPI00262961AF|nr:Gfo/Idh/MocA family oxidoreductase [Acidocella sp.]
MSRLKVGIVSANWGALAHLPAWRTLRDDVEVTAICTSREETAVAAAKQFGVARPFWSYEAMANDPDIDIIDAGTNPVLREKIVTAALTGGKHAVNQIPFATSAEAAVRLENLRRANGVQGVAAASVMGLPHIALMKEMLDAGEIGEVFQVSCSWQMSFFLQIMPGFPYTWFGKSGLGVSVTRNNGSHMLHALRHLFGPVAAVSAQIKTQLKEWVLPGGEIQQVETDDTSHALLNFASGAMGMFSTSWTAADSPGFSIEAFGSTGRLLLTSLAYPSIQTAKLYASKNDAVHHAPSGAEVPVPERFFTAGGQVVGLGPEDMYNGAQRVSLARVFESLVKGIRGESPPLPDFARAAEIQGLIEAMYQSAERRSWVDTAELAKA